MPSRLRLYDMVVSELPGILGLVKGDVPRISQAVNRGQESLLYCEEANDEGWIGGWSEMAFSVDRRNPYITCPRGVARLEAIDVCQRPVPLRGQFYEYMQFGTGRMPKEGRWLGRCGEWQRAGYTRNYSPLMTDISNPPQQIQIFAVNPADYTPNPNTKAVPRVLIQGLDANGATVWTQDGANTVEGEFVTLASPYALTQNSFSYIAGIQKDITLGDVQFFQSDPIWGTSDIILTMEPGESTSWLRRYYIGGIPHGCCPSFRSIPVNAQPLKCGCPYPKREFVQVTALAKLDLIPAVYPTDYLLIQSKEAIIAECQSIRMSKMDDPTSRSQAAQYHATAIRILRGQSIHAEGKNTPSVLFRPFGSADLRRLKIAMQ